MQRYLLKVSSFANIFKTCHFKLQMWQDISIVLQLTMREAKSAIGVDLKWSKMVKGKVLGHVGRTPGLYTVCLGSSILICPISKLNFSLVSLDRGRIILPSLSCSCVHCFIEICTLWHTQSSWRITFWSRWMCTFGHIGCLYCSRLWAGPKTIWREEATQSWFGGRTCDPMESPHWSSLFLKDCPKGKGSTLEQLMKNCRLWGGLIIRNFMKGCLLWEALHIVVGKSVRRKELQRQGVINW